MLQSNNKTWCGKALKGFFLTPDDKSAVRSFIKDHKHKSRRLLGSIRHTAKLRVNTLVRKVQG